VNIIGGWVKRRRGKWHLTESVIDGAAVTHCGRRLEPKPTDEHSSVMPLTRMIGQPQLCRYCDREDA
jgi:hypothetical protein